MDEETYEANKRENGWDETRQENNEALPPGATTAEPRASVPAPTATPITDPEPVDTVAKIRVLDQIRQQKKMEPGQLVDLAEKNYGTRNIRGMKPDQMDGLIEVLDKFEAKVVEVNNDGGNGSAAP